MIVTSSVTLMAEENGIEFKCGVDNHSEDRVLSLEYPIVPNMATITEDGEEDYIAHPFATGFEVNNPMKVLKRTGSGFVYAVPGKLLGGDDAVLYLLRQGQGRAVFRGVGRRRASEMAEFLQEREWHAGSLRDPWCSDMGPGKGIRPHYPVQVSLLSGGGWYEALTNTRAGP